MPEKYKFILKKMNGDYLGEFKSEESEQAEKFLPEEIRNELGIIALQFGERQGYGTKNEK